MRFAILAWCVAGCLSRPDGSGPPRDGNVVSSDGGLVELQQAFPMQHSAGSSASAVLANDVKPGDSLIAVATFSYTNAPGVLWSDTAGDAWIDQTALCFPNGIAIAYLNHAPAKPGTIMVRVTNNTSASIGVYEFSGIATGLAPVASCGNTQDTWIDSMQLTISQPALVFAVLYDPQVMTTLGSMSPFTPADQGAGYEADYANGESMTGALAGSYTDRTMEQNPGLGWMSVITGYDLN